MRKGSAAIKLCILAAVLLSFVSMAYAAGTTNVSIIYGWNGTEFVPVGIDEAGRLKTTINLTKSFGIFPSDDARRDIGSASLRWKSGYFVDLIVDGNLTLAGTLNLNVSSLGANGTVSFTSNFTVDAADSTFFVDATNNRVGIGHSRPNNTLAVKGDINVTGSVIVGGVNVTTFTNISVLHGYNRSGNSFVPLSVNNQGALELSVIDERGAQTLRSGATGSDLTLTAALTVDSPTFYVDAGNDRVGMGTLTPDNILTLLGNELTALSALHINETDNFNNSVANVITLDRILKSPGNLTGAVGLSVLFRAMDNLSQMENIANITAVLYNATNGSELSAITFSTRAADTETGGGHLIERMRIDGQGRVGINVTNPVNALEVGGHINVTGKTGNSTFTGSVRILGTLYGGSPLKIGNAVNITAASGEDALFVSNSAGEKVFRISESGKLNITTSAGNFSVDDTTLFVDVANNRVGVGTTAPTQALVVVGAVNITNGLNVSNGLTVQSGNVGIGIISPNDILDIAGNVRVGGYLNASSINTTGGAYFALNSGRVGIGATSPNVTLHVSGNANITGYLEVGKGLNVSNGMNLISGNLGVGTVSPYNALVVVGSVGVSGSLNASSINTTGGAYFATSSGSVGIGNTIPNVTLHVSGAANITGYLEVGKGLNVSNGMNVISGNVGIGTTSPTDLLTLKASTTERGINITESDSSQSAITGFGWNAGGQLIVYNNSVGVINLDATVGGVAISYPSSTPPNDGLIVQGNVGIGTTNPNYLLQVASGTDGRSVNLSNVLYVNGSSGNIGIGTTGPVTKAQIDIGSDTNAVSAANIYSATNGGLTIKNSQSVGSEELGSFIRFVNLQTPGGAIRSMSAIAGVQSSGNNDISELVFYTHTGAADLTENMRLTTTGGLSLPNTAGGLTVSATGSSSFAGNVGIGTTSPSDTLHITGSDSNGLKIANGQPIITLNDTDLGNYWRISGGFDVNGQFGIRVNSSSTLLSITPSGNVGIGTTKPSIRNGFDAPWLTIASPTPGIYLNDTDTGAEAIFFNSNSGGRLEIGHTNTDGTDNVEMVISTAGNLGIGQTSPNVTLGVSGKANITGTLYANALNVTGKVGIGDPAPPQELSVNGQIYSSASYTNSTIRIGLSQGADASGSYNLLFGASDAVSSKITSIDVTDVPDATVTVLSTDIQFNDIHHLVFASGEDASGDYCTGLFFLSNPGGTCTLNSISKFTDDTCTFSVADGTGGGNSCELRVNFDNSANQNSTWHLTVITNGRR